MKKLLSLVIPFLLGVGLILLAHFGPEALADSGSGSGSAVVAVDSGSAEAGSGSGSSTAPAPHEGIHDPGQAPVQYVDDVKAARRQGWPLAILVGVYGVLIALIRLGWIKKVSGRGAAIAAGLAAVLASTIDALAASGTLWSAVFAAAGAGLLLLQPHKTEAAK